MNKPIKDQVKERMKSKGINVLGLAEQTGIPSSRIYKWYDEKKQANPKEADADILKQWLESSNENVEQVPIQTIDVDALDQKQPIIQVVLNLSYIGKKNADSMDKMADSVKEMTTGVSKMAATNQRNTEIIAALVGTMLPNSKLDPKLRAVFEALYKDLDRPVEDFLKGKKNSPDSQKFDTKASRGS